MSDISDKTNSFFLNYSIFISEFTFYPDTLYKQLTVSYIRRAAEDQEGAKCQSGPSERLPEMSFSVRHKLIIAAIGCCVGHASALSRCMCPNYRSAKYFINPSARTQWPPRKHRIQKQRQSAALERERALCHPE